MPFNQETRDSIIAAFTSQAGGNQAIPPLPATFTAWLLGYPSVTPNIITAADLQAVFKELENDQNYQDAATKFSIAERSTLPLTIAVPVVGLEPQSQVLSASQLAVCINWPKLSHVQRTAIKNALTTVPNTSPLKEEQDNALNESLSQFIPSPNNQLTRENVLNFLKVIKMDAQYLQLTTITTLQRNNIIQNPWPILLTDAALTNKIRAQIVAPILLYDERLILRTHYIQNTPVESIPQSEIDALDTALCAVGPLLPGGSLTKVHSELLLSTIPSIHRRGTMVSVPCLGQNGFWFIKTERINGNPVADQQIIDSLKNSRGHLETRLSNIDFTITSTALLFSACITVLQYFSQQAKAKDQKDSGLGHSLLILPILLGVITGICKQLQGQSKKYLALTNDSLAKLGIDVKHDTDSSIAAIAAPSP